MFGRKPFALPQPPGTGARILFLRYSALGDVVRAARVARALKVLLPEAHLTWLVARPSDDLLRGQPFIDDLIVWDRRRDEKAFFEILGEVRRRRFTHLISLQGSDRSAAIALCSGVPQRFGKARGFRWAYTTAVRDPFTQLLEIPETFVPFDPTESQRQAVGALLPLSSRPQVACVIGASKAVKRWPVANWGRYLEGMVQEGWGAFLVGEGEDETRMAREIRAPFGEKVIDLVGRVPLALLPALLGLARGVVGGDTGPLQIAAAMRFPTVGLFGPTTPEQVGLAGKVHSFVVPCASRGCQRWGCERQECLAAVPAEAVVEASVRLFPKA